MNLLIVSATPFEIQPLMDFMGEHFEKKSDFHFTVNDLDVHFLITGVGMTATAFSLGYILANNKYHLVINAGIAGAFNRELKIGDVVQIDSEQFGDLGVEERDGQFTDAFDLGLVEKNQLPFQNGVMKNEGSAQFNFLPVHKGLTINKVHGTQTSIEAIQNKYDADVESMEGAAFFYACLMADVPFLQIRSISNFVEPRNRANWDLPLAIGNLNKVLKEVIEVLSS